MSFALLDWLGLLGDAILVVWVWFVVLVVRLVFGCDLVCWFGL